MTRDRRGFSLIELFVVFGIFGIMVTLAMPKLHEMMEKSRVRSAKQDLMSYLIRARAAAIQTGRPTAFTINGADMTVFAVTPAGRQVLAHQRSLYAEHKVEVSASTGEIGFDPRGMASNLLETQRIVVSNATARDSVCISRIGKISQRGCL